MNERELVEESLIALGVLEQQIQELCGSENLLIADIALELLEALIKPGHKMNRLLEYLR
jgi:hypothetical protein